MTKMFEGRAAIGYDHGYDVQKFYLGLALDSRYIDGFVEGCLERIGEEDPDGETLLRELWEDKGEREFVLEMLKSGCEILSGRPRAYGSPSTLRPYQPPALLLWGHLEPLS